MAEAKRQALVAFDALVETWGDKAVECLTKDRDALLALYDFPGRTLEASAHDVIESSFPTVRHPSPTRRPPRKAAAASMAKPAAESHPWSKVRRRNRGRRSQPQAAAA